MIRLSSPDLRSPFWHVSKGKRTRMDSFAPGSHPYSFEALLGTRELL